MTELTRSSRSTVRRIPKRAAYDRSAIDAILDAGVVCHVGFVADGQPFVIPMAYAPHGDEILLHGSSASRLMKGLAEGIDVSIAVTHLDGIVVARSAFHSSMNYRSVVLFGRARELTDPAEKSTALEVLVDHLIPGRAAEARGPNAIELRATSVLSVRIDEGSAKVRSGPPLDDEEDYALPIWAGVIPLRLEAGAPEPDGKGVPDLPVPPSVRTYR